MYAALAMHRLMMTAFASTLKMTSHQTSWEMALGASSPRSMSSSMGYTSLARGVGHACCWWRR
jgi:hypothetical protein